MPSLFHIWVELSPPKFKFLTLQYLRIRPYLKIWPLQMSLVKMKSYWIRVDPNPMRMSFKEENLDTDTYIELSEEKVNTKGKPYDSGDRD